MDQQDRFLSTFGGLMFKQTIRILCLLSVFSLSAANIWGQARSSSGDLTGAVLSPSQSSLPGVTVTAVNLATGLMRTVTTDATGNYRIPLLPPGIYEVKVEATGFNTQVKRGITLTVGQIAVINFEMLLGV